MSNVPQQEPGVYQQDQPDLPLFAVGTMTAATVDISGLVKAGYSLCNYLLLQYLAAKSQTAVDPLALFLRDEAAGGSLEPILLVRTERPWLRVEVPTQDVLGSRATGYLRHYLVAVSNNYFERFARHVASSFYVDAASGEYCKLSWQQVVLTPANCKSVAERQQQDFTPVSVALLCLLTPDMIIGLNSYDSDGVPVVGHLRFKDRRANDIMAKTYVTGQDNPVEAVNKQIENELETPYGLLQLQYQLYRAECGRRNQSPLGFLDFVNQLLKEKNAVDSEQKTI